MSHGRHDIAAPFRRTNFQNREVDEDLLYSRLRALTTGDSFDLYPNAYLKKKGRNDYVLIDRENTTRSRWGNIDHIVDDALFYLEHGHLPPAAGPMW